MNSLRVFGAGLMALMAGAALAAEKEKPPEKPLKEVLDALLPSMGAENIPDRQKGQQDWQRLCYDAGAPGNDARRTEACQAMAAKLGPDVAPAARIWLLKQLQIIGRAECVEPVARLVGDQDPHLSDAAIRCLANNSDPSATAALAAKLAAAQDPALKVALLNALAYRADAAATAAIAKELGNANAAAAAARALGKLATPDAAKALAAARGGAKGDARLRVCDALCACADAFLKAGKPDEAMAIYKDLYSKDETRAVRLSALQGILNASGGQAAAKVLELLAGDDPDARAVAAGHVAALSGDPLKALVAGLPNVPTGGQILLLDALAAKRDKAALPAALEATKSQDEELKLAGLRALGSLGDASVVPMLIETSFTPGAAGDTARRSLAAVHGDGVNEKILAAMQAEKDARKRGELIALIEARGMAAAVPALLEEAAGADPALRSRAMAALGRLAGPKDVPAMVKALLKADKGRERDDAEKAIGRVCQQVPEKDKQAEPVLSAIANAADADKAAVLPLLGRLGGPKAMEAVQAALKSANADLGDAAVRALFNWPDASAADLLLDLFESSKEPARRIAALQALVRVATPQDRAREPKLPVLDKALPLVRTALDEQDKALREAAVRALVDWPASAAAPDLLGLAKGAPEPNFRILALRGYVRLAGLVAPRAPQEAIAMHQEAMKLATRPDERRQALAGLGEVRAIEALNIVLPCLDDKDVAGEAAAAAVAIADRLRDTHPKEVKAALEKVLQTSNDRRLIRRAEEIHKHVSAKLAK